MDIAGHYETQLDIDQIIDALRKAYPNGADKYQLAPIDQLHIGGIKASEKLLKHIKPTDNVLEIGSGCGGLMRLVQAQDTDIVGLDISHHLNKLNRGLAGTAHHADIPWPDVLNTAVITGDAHHLPFAEYTFSKVVFQHSMLNMPDAKRVLSECERVLKPHGGIVLHEVLRGESKAEMVFPVPWAATAETSFLMHPSDVEELAFSAGMTVESISDWSQEALTWRKRQQVKEASCNTAKPVISPAMIFGDLFSVMATNVVKNLSNASISVMEIVLKKGS